MFSNLSQGFLKRFHGVTGGIIFRGKTAQSLGEKYPKFKTFNNVLFVAPVWKWGLALVPLYGAVTGSVPIEKVDLNNSAALAGTGVIWAYYSLLVRPRSMGLFSVSVALVVCNGWNVVRKIKANEIAAAKAAGTEEENKTKLIAQ